MGGDRCALWLQGRLHPVLRDGRGVGSGRPTNGVTRNHSSETFLSSDTNLRKKKKCGNSFKDFSASQILLGQTSIVL